MPSFSLSARALACAAAVLLPACAAGAGVRATGFEPVVPARLHGAECVLERTTLEVALDAYRTQTGRPAASLDDLVAVRLAIPAEYDAAGLAVVNGEVAVVGGKPAQCIDHTSLFGAEFSVECAESLMRAAAPAALYEHQAGVPAGSVEEIVAAGFSVDQTDYMFDAYGAAVRPQEWSNCPASSPQSSIQEICQLTYKTLVTATEAYIAKTGAAPESQADIDAEGLLAARIEEFDLQVLDDGTYSIVAVPGGRCDGVPLD